MTHAQEEEKINAQVIAVFPDKVRIVVDDLIDACANAPSSNDIPYWQLWKEKWKDMDFSAIKAEWYK